MKPSPPSFGELYKTWMRIWSKMNLIENIPRDLGVGTPLHLSEIHAILAIGTLKENNIRIIAENLGVTPSATSQVVSRLAKRGLVKKVRGLHNEKEVFLTLTPMGQTAFRNHEEIHTGIYQQIECGIGAMSDDEREVLRRAFSLVESVYDRSIRELTSGTQSTGDGNDE